MDNPKQPHQNSQLFSQDSAFLKQYQAELGKQNLKTTPHISLLTGKVGTQSQERPTSLQPIQQSTKINPQIIQRQGSQIVVDGSATKASHKMVDVPHVGASPQVVAGGSIRIQKGPARSNPSASLLHTRMPSAGAHIIKRQIAGPNPYIRKWRRLKKMIKDLIFINASVCDEVVRVEEKIAKAKEERRFLLRKLLHYQSYTEGIPTSMKLSPGVASSKMGAGGDTSDMHGIKVKSKSKKKPTGSSEKKKAATTKELLDSMQTKPKKSKSQIIKKTIPPLNLDATGRPVFPLDLGELTIHSIGEIVTDHPGFHSSQFIYPEGYCSTRVFTSTINPDKKCLYTCKISDSGKGPVFEIAAEDNNNLVLRSNCLSDCHNLLMVSINKSRGTQLLELSGKGADFFGLSHPVVQNLIQSCPGSKRCSGYKWIKFEINKLETVESAGKELNDITVSYETFKSSINTPTKGGNKSQSILESTSLRSLLTSKPVVSSLSKVTSK